MFRWLAIALLVVPIIELVVVLRVGAWLGWLPTVLLLIAISILGAVLLRAQGRRTLTEISSTIRRGRNPTGPLSDGAMLVFAAALLLTPGYFTDAVGFALLLPPVRALLRPILAASATRSIAKGNTRFVRFDTGTAGRPGDVVDVDSTDHRAQPDDPFASPPQLG